MKTTAKNLGFFLYVFFRAQTCDSQHSTAPLSALAYCKPVVRFCNSQDLLPVQVLSSRSIVRVTVSYSRRKFLRDPYAKDEDDNSIYFSLCKCAELKLNIQEIIHKKQAKR
jgi:hypothetical protein